MTKRSAALGSCGMLVAAAIVAQTPQAGAAALPVQAHPDVALAAGATVLTLEGGVVGLQHLLHFTPLQLQGELCDLPNVCTPVNYFAMPLGQWFNDQGAVKLNEAIAALPDDGTPVVLYGHSQGGQVIYSALRGWAADPSTAPDPSRVSWVSIGNPENTFGGRDPDPIPADSPYQGTEVIRQYDGWADWPTDQRNLLAVLNAVIGMNTVHPFYFGVDIDDPANLRYVEGNVTYVFVPNPMLPLVQATGLLAPLLNPWLDPILRPMVEAGYQRPVNPAAPVAARALAATEAPEAEILPEDPEPVAVPEDTAATVPARVAGNAGESRIEILADEAEIDAELDAEVAESEAAEDAAARSAVAGDSDAGTSGASDADASGADAGDTSPTESAPAARADGEAGDRESRRD